MCGQIRSALHCWARRAGVTQSNFIKVGLSHQGWNQRWVAKRKTFSWFKDQPTNRNRNTSVHNYEYCETTHWTQIFPFDTKWSFNNILRFFYACCWQWAVLYYFKCQSVSPFKTFPEPNKLCSNYKVWESSVTFTFFSNFDQSMQCVRKSKFAHTLGLDWQNRTHFGQSKNVAL